MSLDHEGQALASYVVGALPPDERAAVEAHVASCAECQAELQSLHRVAHALAYAVPRRTPRPELRARVLAIAGEQREGRTVPLSAEPSSFGWATWLPLAAMLVLAVGLGVYAFQLQGRIELLESRLDVAVARAESAEQATAEVRAVADEAQSAMSVLAAPDLARIDLKGAATAPGASARALWSRQRGMVFTASDLPPIASGRIYQVWVVTASGPVSAGLLQPDPAGRGMRVFSTPPDIAAPVAVAVTEEPEGGVPAPTSDPILVGTPVAAL